MLTRPIELDAVQPGADQDAAVLGVYKGAALIALAAGTFGLYMAQSEELPRGQKLRGAAAAGATASLGVAALLRPVALTAILRRRLSPWALPSFGIASVAASGADRSPMFFPAVILAGFGGGRLGPTRLKKGERVSSLVLGGVTSSAYLAVLAAARRPWRQGWDQKLMWNLGMLPTFLAAPSVGGELGDLALTVRRLERARARDRASLTAAGSAARGSLQDLARRIGESAASLDQTLLRVAAESRGAQDPEAGDIENAVNQVRGDIQHHLFGPFLVAAANEETLDLVRTLDAILEVYRSGWRRGSIEMTLDSQLPAALALDGQTTGALVRAAKVALDNSYLRETDALHEIVLTLRQSGGNIVMSARDNGDGVPAEREQWGTGLTETEAHVRSFGGTVALNALPDGVELLISIPAHAVAPATLGAAVPLTRRLDSVLDNSAIALWPVNWVGGIMCFMSARRRRSALAHSLAFIALTVLDRTWFRRDPTSERRPAMTLAGISLLWPKAGRPATGWMGLELVLQGARGNGKAVLRLGALTLAGTGFSGWRVKETVTQGRLRENLGFPLVCAACGLAAAYGRATLARAEDEALGLRERAEMVEQLAHATRLSHEIIKPLRGSSAWYEGRIMLSDDGQALIRLSGELDDLTREMVAAITVADPIRDIQEHLQLRLDPAIVSVSGRYPIIASRRAEEQLVNRAREHLGIVALADELADRILARFPPRLSGRSGLYGVHLDFAPLGESDMRVTVRPIPPQARREDDLGPLVAALAQLRGTLLDGFEDGGMTFTVPATTLLTR